MRTALALGCALLLVTSGIAVTATGQTPEPESPEPTLIYDISIDTDGDATWEISAEFPIATDADSEAFDDLADQFIQDDGEVFLPIEPYEVAVQELRNTLDRPMQIQQVDRRVNRTGGVGILSVSFVWTEFAMAENERVAVGDVFTVGDQTWFARLGANEQLVIRGPDNYTVEDSGLPVENRTMAVTGPVELSPSDLQGTFAGPDASGGQGILWPLIIGGVLALGIVLVLLLWGYRSGIWDPFEDERGEEVPQADSEMANSANPDDHSPGGIMENTLLSDEERVLALIEEQDGRMKQADIVTTTDWSNAKVSQLLSQMADEGDVEKLRLGRENLIRIPDEDEAE